jgi:hypothetical protein
MNQTSAFQTVLALVLAAVVVCFVIFRPNTIRRLFGTDTTAGTDSEVQVLRDRLRARTEHVVKEIDAATDDYNRLEKEVVRLKPALDVVMKHKDLQETEYPDLCREAAKKPDGEFLAEFYSLAKQVSAARRDLDAGGNPKEWEGIVDDSRKKAQMLSEDSKRRRAALEQIKQKFLRSGG